MVQGRTTKTITNKEMVKSVKIQSPTSAVEVVESCE
jgi:hypothetical protein